MSEPPPPVATLVDLMRFAADRFADREFLRFQRRSLTFTEFDRETARLANFLVLQGIRAGHRVAIFLPNCVEWPVTWLGVLRAGAIAVPVNARYRGADLAHVLSDSEAVAIITDAQHAGIDGMDGVQVLVLDELRERLAHMPTAGPGVRVRGDHIANLQYTSGTTGLPKGCVLSHEYWVGNAWALGGVGEITAEDVVLTAQPFSYIDPQWNLTMCLLHGAVLVVLPGFSASTFWTSVRDNGVTWFYVLGTMPVLLFKQPPSALDQTHRVRMILCSGIVASLHHEFERRWGAPWREVYGLTEEGGCLAVPLSAIESVGSGVIGRPYGAKDVVVLDPHGAELPDGQVGELVVRGRPMMQGYWRQPSETEETLRAGQLHTGDLGMRDQHGWFRLVGRRKDMVRRGGENISCAEVEHVLDEHPAVSASAVVAVPDEIWGEEAKAFIQLVHPVPATSLAGRAEEILDHVRDRLASFKTPRFVEFVDQLPMTPSARVAKGELRRRDEAAPGPHYDAADRIWRQRAGPPDHDRSPHRADRGSGCRGHLEPAGQTQRADSSSEPESALPAASITPGSLICLLPIAWLGNIDCLGD